MSYVDSNLLPGEQVTFRTRLHLIIFATPFALALLALFLYRIDSGIGNLALFLALALGVVRWIDLVTSEFAVTNKRVIFKEGFLGRRTIELLLQKVESIEVKQGIAARILGYGDIIVIGTGATHEPFARVSAPLDLRRAVQSGSSSVGSHELAGAGADDTRTCPYCAEQIKRAAIVCRYCGRDVPPAAARPVAPPLQAGPSDNRPLWRHRLTGMILIGMVIAAVVVTLFMRSQ
jgi:hypothetical protein